MNITIQGVDITLTEEQVQKLREKLEPQDITERVKTVDDAYKLLGRTRYTDAYRAMPNHIKAQLDIEVVVEALNEGWTPDWNDNNQPKYYPLFDLRKSKNNPSGFCLGDVFYDYSDSYVPSRLCFRTRELAEYAAEQFIDIYKQFFTT